MYTQNFDVFGQVIMTYVGWRYSGTSLTPSRLQKLPQMAIIDLSKIESTSKVSLQLDKSGKVRRARDELSTLDIAQKPTRPPKIVCQNDKCLKFKKNSSVNMSNENS